MFPPPTPNITWVLATVGWAKLNINGSWTSDGRAGAGMVLRDNKGHIIYTSCREVFSCRNALEAELSTCMEGLSLAIPITELPIQVEMDSREALNMIMSDSIDLSILSTLVKEIKVLKKLRSTTFSYVHRNQNNVSDYLAKYARMKSRTVVWLNSGLPEIIELCNADCGIST
ncbi:hypothetical protein ZWY2020_053348 [Hordeum vulgare]|nr:hypothetical protein ZWY2020_053348 [Hordeum vulgare]